MTANFVAKELNYKDSHDWGTCHQATYEAFHGPHFSFKFEEMVALAKEMGFDAIELWIAHLDPIHATKEMIERAQYILQQYEMEVVSYTAGFGSPGITEEEVTLTFDTAKAIGAPVLAQAFHPENGPIVKRFAEQYGIKMGLENHPEKTPDEVIEKVGPFSPWIGAAIDTGWFATHGYDVVQAVKELKDHLVHIHLKDIKQIGAHDSCTLGDGVVNVKAVLRTLKELDYQGAVTIEHEPHHYDPTDDVVESLNRVKKWWQEIVLETAKQ